MGYETFEASRLTPHLGANISGLDLTRPLSNRQLDELHDALVTHEVLFFRDQSLDIESHKRLGRYFGELAIHPNTPGPEGHPELLPIHADAHSKRIAGENWHSDVSCSEEPPLGSILHLKEVPEVGGDTLFASQTAAYDALSPRMKTYLEGLTALHAGERNYRRNNEKDGIDDRGRSYPSAVHPVIRTHPVSGRKLIFVNEVFTMRINELPEDEGRAVLEFLYKHSTKPDVQVRFKWQPNSVAFWDNRSVQHLALWDYYPQVRSGFRVTIKGDRPH
ncbi:MAG: TauD/TfdA family dioxygenase [Acetobacteraceae bacterium]|nr:TauD/TfdA family dioxygenase [Acetobacteraceae bacterium]